MWALKLESFFTKVINESRLIIDSTFKLNSFSSSLLEDNFDKPLSCLSRPTIKEEGVAETFLINFMDYLPAVPADKTSSIIKTLPLGISPMILPPSP